MASQPQTKALAPIERFRSLVQTDRVQEHFNQLLKDRAPEFLASLLSLVGSDDYLQKCEPATVFTAAAKAAILQLPIAKELGYAWIIPYGKEAQFQIGVRGLVQLAMRTAQYYAINATTIYEGEEIVVDRLTGSIKLNGKRTGDESTGYVAYFKLKNGYEKYLYMSKEDTERHAKRFSKSYGNPKSAWSTSFDAMGEVNVLRNLLRKYGLLSIEMQDDDSVPFLPEEDPRLTAPVPDFTGIIDGTMSDPVDPEPEPQPTASGPDAILDAVVATRLSENIHSARNTLVKCTTGYDTAEKAIAWMKLYRGWRDMGANSNQAAEKANSGEVPH